jgi:hypothetical protein
MHAGGERGYTKRNLGKGLVVELLRPGWNLAAGSYVHSRQAEVSKGGRSES